VTLRRSALLRSEHDGATLVRGGRFSARAALTPKPNIFHSNFPVLDEGYAREELVAELGGAFLSAARRAPVETPDCRKAGDTPIPSWRPDWRSQFVTSNLEHTGSNAQTIGYRRSAANMS